MKQKNKRIIQRLIIIYLIIQVSVHVFLGKNVYADDNTIEEQKESFNISSYINKSNEYIKDYEINIGDIFNEANSTGKINNSKLYNVFIKILGKEFKNNLQSVLSIIIICIIYAIIKSISEDLNSSNVSQIVFFTQYIIIVTIIIQNFYNIIESMKTTISNLVDFMNMLVPILSSLMLFTGSIATTSVFEPIILIVITVFANIVQNVLIPITLIIIALMIISKITDRVQIDKLSKLLKSSVLWILGTILTIFVGLLSLEGTLSSSIDGITAKTAKAVVTSAIPVVGKVLADSVDSVLGCGVILKNSVGFVGVIVVLAICMPPILKLAVLSITYNLAAGLIEPLTDSKISKLLNEMGDVFKLLLGIICAFSFMLIIGITLAIKISNIGIMYR